MYIKIGLQTHKMEPCQNMSDTKMFTTVCNNLLGVTKWLLSGPPTRPKKWGWGASFDAKKIPQQKVMSCLFKAQFAKKWGPPVV